MAKATPKPKRRSQDDMLKALAVLTGQSPKHPDDDSHVVLGDALQELFTLRQIAHDLMQGVGNAHQQATLKLKDM